MQDLNISLTAVLAAVGWTIGSALVGLNLFVDRDLGSVGVMFVAAAATLNIRGFFCCQARREKNAFALGHDYGCGRGRSLN